MRRIAAVGELWARLPDAWSLLSGVLDDARHDAPAMGEAASADATVASWTRIFDLLAVRAPEACVALYTLGDADLLERASREIVDALQRWGDLRPGMRVLDLGCGIGRLSGLIAASEAEVLGVDVSGGMLSQARRRCAVQPRAHFARLSGHDLAALADASFDLVLAVDVFPYLVLAGDTVARRHVMDIARVLRGGGRLVLANLSYRGDDQLDKAGLQGWLTEAGMTLLSPPARPFALWDGLGCRAELPAA